MQMLYLIYLIVTICELFVVVNGHTAQDFDDSTHYKIEFATPTDFNPDKPVGIEFFFLTICILLYFNKTPSCS